jgi:ABC-type multidrug transport system fused ATPase/permease subunit
MTVIIQQVPDFIEFLGRSDSVLKHFKKMADTYETIGKTTDKTHELEFKNIRMQNVSFNYSSNNTPLFENLNMSINTNNNIIGITGLSGNGKSTFIKLILKLYKCDSGTIFIDGIDIKDIGADYIRKNMTYVNQTSKLFDKKI